MTAERWQQIKAIFDGAVECDPPARAEFLSQHCAGNEEIRREVESLLASDRGASSVLETPALAAAAIAAQSLSAMRMPASGAQPPLVLKDRYEVERELGRGGMSVVYVARDRQLLDKRVVVKVLHEQSHDDPWVRQKFQQEMEALARIDHPGVVGVLDHGSTPEGKQFLVMQYVEGATLRDAIQPGGMPLARAAGILRQVGQALAAAHEKGVWHRDLKPENIMLQSLGGEEHVKLIDFGIAGIQNSQFTGEKTKVAGSLAYMAPEQFAGQPCAASDIYALGVVACEMFTGAKPFAPDSMMHLVAGDTVRPAPLRELRPALPAAAERSLLKAMSFRPGLRHATAREFSEELCRALTSGAETTTAARRAPGAGTVEIAHVLFTDLVGYSLLPMDQQKDYLAQLQQIVRDSPRFRAAEDAGEIISLPTGDGMALAFSGDPTAPAQCALEVAAGLKSRPNLKLRMGIHSGPVYRVADVNANANLAGGGINLAQRVMDCGDAGHILVSKSVADVLLQFSQWAPHLSDLGEVSVKHGVQVHIYNLVTDEAGNRDRPAKLKVAAPPGRRWKVRVAAAAALVLIAASGAYLRFRRPHLLTERDSIVLADFANTTGDPVFDGTLRQALTLKLAESPFLSILSDQQTRRTLRLMARGEDTPLTHALGREICARKGLKAVVTGTISQLGNSYVVELDATNCATGESLVRAGGQASGKEAVLPVLGKAAVELRARLGESLASIRQFDHPFEATSSSLQALEAYTLSRQARRERRLNDQFALLKRAVELDPKFAYAYATLAAESANLKRSEDAAEYARKAFELRDRVTEPEKFRLVDKFYGSVTGQLDERIQSAKLWTLAYPRDDAAFSNLAAAYGIAGQPEKGLEAAREAIRLAPTDSPIAYVNAMGYAAALGRFDEAQRIYDDARAHKIAYRHLPVYYYAIAFLRHDDAAMDAAFREAMAAEGGDYEILSEQAGVEAYRGRLRSCRDLLQRAADSAAADPSRAAQAYAARAHVEALFEAPAAARQYASRAIQLARDRDVLTLAGWSFAIAGDAGRARQIAQELALRYPVHTILNRVYLPALRASLDPPAQAIEGLQAAKPYELASSGGTMTMYAVYARGQAYLRARDGAAAAVEFQKILDHPGVVASSPLFPLALLGAARAHALGGDGTSSGAAYQRLFETWKDADADLPALVAARREAGTAR